MTLSLVYYVFSKRRRRIRLYPLIIWPFSLLDCAQISSIDLFNYIFITLSLFRFLRWPFASFLYVQIKNRHLSLTSNLVNSNFHMNFGKFLLKNIEFLEDGNNKRKKLWESISLNSLIEFISFKLLDFFNYSPLNASEKGFQIESLKSVKFWSILTYRIPLNG